MQLFSTELHTDPRLAVCMYAYYLYGGFPKLGVPF